MSTARPVLPSRWRALRNVVTGEIAFLFFTAVSVALHPGFVLKRNEGGMSNYGLHIKTALFYTLALGLLALYSHRAALLYKDGDTRSSRLRLLLISYSSIVFLVLMSTYFYSMNVVLKNVHFTIGTALIVTVGVGSLWMYRQWPPSMVVRLLLFVQLAGDFLALMSAIGALRVLFLAEMLSNIGFAALLVRTCRRVAAEDQRDAASFHTPS